MKILSSLSAFALAVALVVSVVPARAETWETDYAKAVKSAGADKKMVLMDFTGSDWCSWCHKLDKEVFSQPAFKEFAEKHLVLVKLDFPQGFKLPAETEKQNNDLAKQYGIEGYPTIVVLNSDGKKVGELGYMEGGAPKFIEALQALPKS